MKNILALFGITGIGVGCIGILVVLFVIKPLCLLGLIWILRNWCDFTLIPMLTFWQSVVIIWIFSLLTYKNTSKQETKTETKKEIKSQSFLNI